LPLPPSFQYNSTNLAEIAQSISAERLSTYLATTLGNQEDAVRLYLWNTAISAAFYGPLQTLEVTIRNRFHQELVRVYGPHWYDHLGVPLTADAWRLVQQAKDKLSGQNKAHDPGRIVAELSFGFWERLLTLGPRGAYEMKLWRPALHKAFPHARLKRTAAHQPIQHLRVLRNRIAHHEPIYARHLAQDYRSLTTVLGWISPEVCQWVEHHSEIDDVLARRP
jgi:hypothetical protein